MCFREVRDVKRYPALRYYAAICLTLCCRLDAGAIALFNSCPEMCRCIVSPSNATEAKTFENVVCRGEELNDLRLIHIPQKTLWLDLSHCSLQWIPSYFFIDHGIVDLTELDLSSNNISFIDHHTFVGLNVLKYLDLSYNRILHFEPNSLLYNELLTHIYLRGTDVPLPEEGSLIMSHTLKLLDVSDCRISSLPTLVFSEIPYLLVLNISRNPVAQVDVKILDNLTWLRELDVSKTNLRCDQRFAPLAEWAKSYSVRLTGYPCLNSHHDEAVFRSNRRKPTTLKDEGPEWPTPESVMDYADDEENRAPKTSSSIEPHSSGNAGGSSEDSDSLNDTVGLESYKASTFWAGMLSNVNWTFWLLCFGCFTLGVALTITAGWACYSCCRSSDDEPNELVSAGNEFQLVQSELGYEDQIIHDRPPSYSSLFSSRYQKVLPTPQLRYGRGYINDHRH